MNTTGSDVGEVWAVGDILWVHQTLGGKLTNVKPTAPDLAIAVAAVVVLDATNGQLLVRPRWQIRTNYGTFLNTVDHVADSANTPTVIGMDATIKSRGFNLTGPVDSRINCEVSGLYNFTVSYQITSTNAAAKDIYFWVRKNGVDELSTTRKKSIVGNGVFDTFATTWSISLVADDYVQLVWAVTNTTVILEAPAAVAFAPAAPSVMLTITEIAL